MTRIRIVCKSPGQTRVLPGKNLYNVLPSMADCEVYTIDDEGNQTLLTNVESITFRAVSDCTPVRARLTFFDVEMDVEAGV